MSLHSSVATVCVACGSHAARSHVLDIQRWSIERCKACGMHTLSPAPDGVATEGFNDGSEYDVAFAFRGAIMKQHDRCLAALERHVKPGRLLDVGCGPGMLLEAARARGWDAQGVDPSPWSVEKAHELGFVAHQGMLEDLSLERESFDAIALLQVVEHMVDPRPLLASCRTLLKPGGALLVATPNPVGLLALTKKEAFNYWIPPIHCVWYSPRALSMVLGRAGFDVIRTSTWSARAQGLHDGMALLESRRATSRLPMRARRMLGNAVATMMDTTKRGTIVEHIAVKP